MLSLTAFADEMEREKARQRTYDAMRRKARAGHVTGGRVYGYDNVEVLAETPARTAAAARARRPADQPGAGRGRPRILRASWRAGASRASRRR